MKQRQAKFNEVFRVRSDLHPLLDPNLKCIKLNSPLFSRIGDELVAVADDLFFQLDSYVCYGWGNAGRGVTCGLYDAD